MRGDAPLNRESVVAFRTDSWKHALGKNATSVPATARDGKMLRDDSSANRDAPRLCTAGLLTGCTEGLLALRPYPLPVLKPGALGIAQNILDGPVEFTVPADEPVVVFTPPKRSLPAQNSIRLAGGVDLPAPQNVRQVLVPATNDRQRERGSA